MRNREDRGASVPDRAGGAAHPSPAVSAKGAHPSREHVARLLHSKLFATCTDWREERVPWEELHQIHKNAFLHTADEILKLLEGQIVMGVDDVWGPSQQNDIRPFLPEQRLTLPDAATAALRWFDAAGAQELSQQGTDWLNEGGWDAAGKVATDLRAALDTKSIWLIERRVSPPQWSAADDPTGVGDFFGIERAHRFPTKDAAENAMRRMAIKPEDRGQFFVSEHVWTAAVTACEECGRIVVAENEAGTGFMAECGRRLASLDQCSEGGCSARKPMTGADLLRTFTPAPPEEADAMRRFLGDDEPETQQDHPDA